MACEVVFWVEGREWFVNHFGIKWIVWEAASVRCKWHCLMDTLGNWGKFTLERKKCQFCYRIGREEGPIGTERKRERGPSERNWVDRLNFKRWLNVCRSKREEMTAFVIAFLPLSLSLSLSLSFSLPTKWARKSIWVRKSEKKMRLVYVCFEE